MAFNYTRSETLEVPNGYKLVYEDNILPSEVITLRESVGWDGGDTEEGWQSTLQDSIAVVGVRDTDTETLVGIGFIAGNRRHAILCDFTVHPDHQGKKIGLAILDERIRIIGELAIPFSVTALSDENPLKSRYEEHGFVPGALFRDNS